MDFYVTLPVFDRELCCDKRSLDCSAAVGRYVASFTAHRIPASLYDVLERSRTQLVMLSIYADIVLLAVVVACLSYIFRDNLRKLLRIVLYNSTKLKDEESCAEQDLEGLEYGSSRSVMGYANPNHYGIAAGGGSANRRKASYDEMRQSMSYTDNSYLYNNAANNKPMPVQQQQAVPHMYNNNKGLTSSQVDTLPRPNKAAPRHATTNHYYNAMPPPPPPPLQAQPLPPPLQAQPLPHQHPLALAQQAGNPPLQMASPPLQMANPPFAKTPPPPPAPPAITANNTTKEATKNGLEAAKNGLEAFTMGIIPSVQLRELQLQNVLGGGAFGQVWQGSWQGTPVAVKVLSTACQSHALPKQVLSAFEEEVKMLASLRHPNVCLFLAACLDPPNRAIVTELVSRGSLWGALRQQGILADDPGGGGGHWPAWAVRKVLDGTCRGLVYLHSHQPPVIHRDLKSANLLLDESFNVKICDFGLARLRDYTSAMTANVGTVQWMAPEVLSGQPYTESADVYSIGIIAWEVLTGQCPYEGQSHIDVALAVVHKHARPDIPIGCPAAQADFLRHCWSHTPSHRPSAAQALASIAAAF